MIWKPFVVTHSITLVEGSCSGHSSWGTSSCLFFHYFCIWVSLLDYIILSQVVLNVVEQYVVTVIYAPSPVEISLKLYVLTCASSSELICGVELCTLRASSTVPERPRTGKGISTSFLRLADSKQTRGEDAWVGTAKMLTWGSPENDVGSLPNGCFVLLVGPDNSLAAAARSGHSLKETTYGIGGVYGLLLPCVMCCGSGVCVHLRESSQALCIRVWSTLAGEWGRFLRPCITPHTTCWDWINIHGRCVNELQPQAYTYVCF